MGYSSFGSAPSANRVTSSATALTTWSALASSASETSSVSSLKEVGVNLHGLTTWWDVIAEAEDRGYFPPDKAKVVRSFLENPEGWTP